jgi:hypothetical protein
MAEVAEVVRYREHNDLDDEGAVFEYIQKIASAVNNEKLNFSDEEYVSYILNIERDLGYEEIFDLTTVPDYVDIPQESYNRYVEGMPEFKLTLISALLMYYLQSNQFTRAEQFFHDTKNELDISISRPDGSTDTDSDDVDSKPTDVDEFPLLPYFRSRIALENLYAKDHPEIASVIELANKARATCGGHYLMRTNFARSIARAFEDSPSFSYELADLPSSKENLLDEAIQSIEAAIAVEDEYSPSFGIKARLYALKGDFDTENSAQHFQTASEAIRRAIELEGSTEQASSDLRRQYTRIQREIRLREDTASLSREVSEASKRLERISKELDQTVEQYRKNTLSFIGFFAALITLAVTSTQILSGAGGTLSEKAILIIVLAGALLFAFGGFGLLLPSLQDKSGKRDYSQPLMVVGLGAVILLITISLIVIRNIF